MDKKIRIAFTVLFLLIIGICISLHNMNKNLYKYIDNQDLMIYNKSDDTARNYCYRGINETKLYTENRLWEELYTGQIEKDIELLSKYTGHGKDWFEFEGIKISIIKKPCYSYYGSVSDDTEYYTVHNNIIEKVLDCK